MKKNKLAIFLIITYLVFLIGCSGKTSKLNPNNPTTITLWHYYGGESLKALDRLINEFNYGLGLDKGIIVEGKNMANIADLEEHLTKSLMDPDKEEELPNIFSTYPDKALELDGYRELVNLKEYFNKDDLESYVDDFLIDGYFSQDRLLLVPIAKSTELLYINNSALNSLEKNCTINPNDLKSWEGIYRIAKDYYEYADKKTPDMAWDGDSMLGVDNLANYIIVGSKQLGLDIISYDDKGKHRVILDEEVLQRVFELYYKGYCLEYFNAYGKFRSDDLKAGKLIAYTGSSSGASYFPSWIEDNSEKVDIDFLACPYPVFEGADEYSIQQGAGMSIISSDRAHEEGAAIFLKWFTEEENNIDFVLPTGYLPVQKESYSSEKLLSNLAELEKGDKNQQNIKAVYDISLEQVMEKSTYAVKSFEGSYMARRILEDSYLEALNDGRDLTKRLKEEFTDEETILDRLDIELAFNRWLSSIESRLEAENIAYERISR